MLIRKVNMMTNDTIYLLHTLTIGFPEFLFLSLQQMVSRRAPLQTAQSKVRLIKDSHTAKLARNMMFACYKKDITITRDLMCAEKAREKSRWVSRLSNHNVYVTDLEASSNLNDEYHDLHTLHTMGTSESPL